jgi:hypothetical protein
MRRTLPLLALALGAAVCPAWAQDASSVLQVHVVDEKGAPLPGAYVTVAGVQYGATTDAAGEARVTRVPRGNRLMIVSHLGYAFDRRPGEFSGRDTVRVQVAMKPAPVELEGITVTTQGRNMELVRNGFYDRQRRGMGAFMTRQRLDDLRPFRTADAFRYMRGFMVRPVGARNVVVGTRRGDNCVPAVFLDGSEMYVRSYQDQVEVLDMVRPDDIEAIEAYQGPDIPGEYDPRGRYCGVIVIWTRH